MDAERPGAHPDAEVGVEIHVTGRPGRRRPATLLLVGAAALEGIAFRLNRHMSGVPRAAEIWKRYLICAFYTARAGIGPVADLALPELASFAHAWRPTIDRHRCRTVVLPARDP